ncbi:MAG: homoserine kinase [Gammaproteobacteria bacterium]|nr:MAG: homoserine kinase [Gammaproteobacteria bacterium]
MSVKVFAPISIGNVSVGFDVLGLAVTPIDGSLIGDIVHVEGTDGPPSQSDLKVAGTHSDRLPAEKEANIVWQCLLAFNRELESLGHQPQGVQLLLEKNIPTSSGLGSSACSVVAALYALNEYYSKPFGQQKLLTLMVELEAEISGSKHYDNVAPCYLGGLQFIVDQPGKISQTLPLFDDCYWVMAYPDILVSTKAAREILPKKYDRQISIQFGQNLAGFIDASYRQDKDQAFALLNDVLAEPYRKHLLPNFEKAKQELTSLGCLSVGISGSGPTLFAVTDDLAIAERASLWLTENYLQTEHGFVHICKADEEGTRCL